MKGQIIAEQEAKGFIEKVDNFHTIQALHQVVRKDLATTPVCIVRIRPAVIWPSQFK